MSSNKKALILGFCYPSRKEALPGCQTDSQAVSQLLSSKGYQVEIVTDENKKSLGSIISTFLTSATPGGQYILYYSGHGTENNNRTTFYNSDLQPWKEEQFRGLLQRVSTGVKLILIIDACNSGTACDLPFCYKSSTTGRPISLDLASGEPFKADIISLAASHDNQLAYNIYDNGRQGVYGAFTKSFLDQLNNSRNWVELVNNINKELSALRFTQTAQLCASKLDLLVSPVTL